MKVQTGKQTPGKNRIFSLDFLRVFATILIIGFHFESRFIHNHPELPVPPLPSINIFWISKGVLGVCIFMFLSGAGLMFRYRDRFDTISFYRKRFCSIMIPFYVCFISFRCCLALIGKFPKAPAWTLVFSLIGLDSYASFFMPTWYTLGEWFLGMILVYYLFFPLLRLAFIRKPKLSLLISCMVSVSCLLIYQRNPDILPINYWMPVYLPFFFSGMAMADLHRFLMDKDPKRRKRIASVLCMIGLMICILVSSIFWGKIPKSLDAELTRGMIFSSGLLLSSISFFTWIWQPRSTWILQPFFLLSKYSWCMILCHHVTIEILFKLLPVTRFSNLVFLCFYLVTLFIVLIEAVVFHTISSYIQKKFFG